MSSTTCASGSGRTRWTDAVAGSGWAHGTDIDYLRELASYWVDGFDWRARERLINECLPGWAVRLGGRQVHFAHCPGVGPAPLPLVLLHGWPGSFVEMYKVAPALADPAAHGGDPADAFDVVVPSLPGHGLSEPVLAPGFGADGCADVVWALITEVLGAPRFGAQGGDRGAFVSAGLGHRHPDAVVGIHLNLATGIPGAGTQLTEDERRWLNDQQRWLGEEGGYIAIQGTRPQTIGVALNDSPVGLLAWIVEKWRAWSDCGGDVESLLHEVGAADQRDPLLGHRDHPVLDALLLRAPAQRAGGRASRADRRSHRRGDVPGRGHAAPPAAPSSASSTSAAGPRCPWAVISPPWSSRGTWWRR
jgi:microsomal epoxide hydrolase